MYSISGNVTLALLGYSGVFMRYALAVQPKNYLLFGCHVVNFAAQSVQASRYVNYRYMGGKEAALQLKANEGLSKAEGVVDQASGAVKEAARKVESGAKDLAGQAKAQVEKVTR